MSGAISRQGEIHDGGIDADGKLGRGGYVRTGLILRTPLSKR